MALWGVLDRLLEVIEVVTATSAGAMRVPVIYECNAHDLASSSAGRTTQMFPRPPARSRIACRRLASIHFHSGNARGGLCDEANRLR